MSPAGSRQSPFAREEDEAHAFMLMIAQGYVAGRITRAPDLSYETSVADEVAS